MAVQKIEYENKTYLQNDPDVPEKNKVTEDNMNEIKSKVNNNADELSTAQQNIEDLQEGQGTASSDITSLKNRVTILEGDNTKNKQDIANKVDKVEGKGLSTEDYTTAEKEKLAGLSNYDDTEIKKDIQDLESDISDIKEEQTAQNDLLQRTQSALINITTEKSSNINVKDSSDLNAKVDVYGISEQKTRSGINLTNYEDWTEISGNEQITEKDDDKVVCAITSSSYGVCDIERTLKPNTNYTACADFEFNGTFGNQYGLRVNVNGSITSLKTDGLVNFTTDETGKARMQCYVGFPYTGADATLTVSNIRLYEGTYTRENIPDYEEYGASPSPKYPSNIENVGDNINLFDISKITSGSIVINNDGTLTIKNNPNTNGYVQQTKKLSELCPNLKVGDIATLSFKTTTKNSSYANSIYVGEAWNNGTYKTITQSMLDFQVGFYGGYNEISIISEIKIEKGTKQSSYSTYNCGNIDITVCNKNLFNGKVVNVATDGEKTAAASNYVSTFIKAVPGKSYSISKKVQTSRFRVAFSKEIPNVNAVPLYGGYMGTEFDNKLKIENMVAPAETNYMLVYVSNLSENISNIDLQIEEDNAATEYVEHKEQLITFPLAEGQKLADGDYLASDGIHHKRTQVEFDGTENWGVIHENIFWMEFSDTKLFTSAIMTHFKYVKKSLTELLDNEFTTSAGQGHAFWIKKEGMALEEFKSFLSQQKQAGTPVIVEYELAEETVEAYTEAQQEAYNKLQNAQSYYNVTNVFTDKAQLVFKYIADTKTYVDNETNSIKEQLNTINELLSTTATSATLLKNLQSDLESEVT